MTTQIAAFTKKVEDAFGKGIMHTGSSLTQLGRSVRFSSGIPRLDLALGGGWPFGRIVVLGGEASTGKSELMLQAAASVQNYDHATKVHKSALAAGMKLEPGRALYVDTEGTFDETWAKCKGFDTTYHYVARPATGEQAVDIVASAIETGVFDLIVIDSLAQMISQAVVDASAEDSLVANNARMNNRAFSRWQTLLNRAMQIRGPAGAPALIISNQFRLQIGLSFGDPRFLPGGKMQVFASSIIIYTKSAKVNEASTVVEMGGTVFKNKTYTPKQTYTFSMGIAKGQDLPYGEVDRYDQMKDIMKEGGWCKKSGGKYHLFGVEYPSLDAVAAALRANPDLYRKAHISAMTHLCSCTSC